jgi:AraC-like DNA-binding protein
MNEHAHTYHRLETVRNYSEIHMAVWHYVELHRDKRVGIEDFVAESGYSKRQIQRALAWYETSWQQMFLTVRLNYAKAMLAHTDLSIREIAKRAAYDHSQFTKMFKAEEGITPEEYRQWIKSVPTT